MKKYLIVAFCAVMLASCSMTGTKPQSEQELIQQEQEVIEATELPDLSEQTVLDTATISLGNDFADITLSTDAKKDKTGEMIWDDSQAWTLTVDCDEGDDFVLFDERTSGRVYYDVTQNGDEVIISVIQTTTAGLEVTEYKYANGAFVKSAVLTTDSNGNNIHTSFPEY